MDSKIGICFTVVCWLVALCLADVPVLDCNRSCLEGVVSTYLTALTAHNSSAIPITPGVRYVENDQVIPLGTGLWPIASSPGKYKHIFADPEFGQVAAITTIKENNIPAIYVFRLKVEADGNISEIETQITRDPTGADRYQKMGKPEDVWLEAVPTAQRISRARLIEQTNRYYSGMERNDPKGNYSFFDKNCSRLEDGLQTTNVQTGEPYGHSNDTVFTSLSCEAQFQTGFLGFVTQIRDRNFPVVDEERQVVFAITTLDHNGTVRELPSVNGTASPIPPYFDVPRSLMAGEAFRLKGDKLFRIEMTLTEVPYGMRYAFRTGWKDIQKPPDPNIQVRDDKLACDRNCLDSFLEKVFRAILTRNTSTLPLAQGFRYSENGQFLPLGDGLWETVEDIARPSTNKYAVNYADPITGTAAYWGLTREQSTPGVLALRIKVDGDQKITEIEALSVRAEYDGVRGGTKTLMRPPLPIEYVGDDLGKIDTVWGQANAITYDTVPELINTYFDAQERHSSSGVPFTSGCMRQDNGLRSNTSCAVQMDGGGLSPNGLFNRTTTVRERRILITDSVRGVVLAVALVDSPTTGPGSANLRPSEVVPSTYLVPQLIGIMNGSISRVESMIKWMPYGYASAWV